MNDTKGVQQECGICLLLGSTNGGKSYSTENHRRSGHDKKIIGENVSNPSPNSHKNARRCTDGRMEKGIRPPPEEWKTF